MDQVLELEEVEEKTEERSAASELFNADVVVTLPQTATLEVPELR